MSKHKNTGRGVALGVIFGTLLGVLTDNIGLWLPIGIALGAAFSQALPAESDSKHPTE